MRVMPRSLFGRLLALSLLATLAALVIAGFAIAGVLERFVTGTVDARLADRILALETTVRRDGSIDPILVARMADRIGPDEPWRIDAPKGSAGTRRADGVLLLAVDDDPHFLDAPPEPRRASGGRGPIPQALPTGVRRFDARIAGGPPVHGLTSDVITDAGAATIIVSVSRRVIDRPIWAALTPLALSLLALGAALAIAAVVQLRLGLRPLGRLRSAIGDVREGRAQDVPEDQPDELRPLAVELNALIGQNAAALANARGHVANLAHGLKTPLATLSLGLSEAGADPGGRLSAEVARIDRAIRHHLGRARADAAGIGAQSSTPIAPAVAGLAEALARIHADRAITTETAIAPELSAVIDPQDLDELLGNLLDNAWRWALSRIAVEAQAGGGTVTIRISDDGPGIPSADRATALAAGQRLDERGDGHGFGLAIARELVELHGGSLTLGDSALGGLAVRVILPSRIY